MRKYNKDSNNYPLSFADGGCSMFLNDFVQLESNTTISSIYSVLKGFSCVLSGVEITNVNITNKTCDVSEGLVLIDSVVYQIAPIVGQTYPFSITDGNVTPITRYFKIGDYKDIGDMYDYTIRTSFVYEDATDLYPNLDTNEVFFNPFTCQKASYILKNIGAGLNESRLKNNSSSIVNKDEQGNYITGGVLNYNINNVLMWKYYGWELITNQGKLSLNSTVGSSTGSNSLTLVSNNIPAHNHTLGSTAFTTQDGGHFHDFNNAFNSENVTPSPGKIFAYGVPARLTNKNDIIAPTIGLSSAGKDFDNNPLAFSDITYTNGLHNHTLGGTTNNNTTTNTPLDITGKEYGVQMMVWKGYPTNYTITNPSSGNGQTVIGYKFWKGNITFNNM